VHATTQKRKFRPGELAPITGIYLVVHGSRHRTPHEVVIIRGEHLPACRTCKVDTFFEIVRPISHITHDWDFSGPNNLVVRPKHEEFHDFRMFRRVHIELPVTVQFPGSSELIYGHSSDLSAGGMGAIIRGQLPSRTRGGTVKISPPAGRKQLSFDAQLRYQSGVRCGFEFTTISVAGREAIRRLIETQKHRAAQVAD